MGRKFGSTKKISVHSPAIRCLIVQESITDREILRLVLSDSQLFHVVGTASEHDQALAKTLELRPNVIVLDLSHAESGLATLREIMHLSPTGIVAIGGSEEIKSKALELGAVQVLGRHETFTSEDFENRAREIREAVRAVARITPNRPNAKYQAPTNNDAHQSNRLSALINRPTEHANEIKYASHVFSSTHLRCPACFGIVASTGGPAALKEVFSALPEGFPVPIVVVQHIAHGFCEGLTRLLRDQTKLNVRIAKDGEHLRRGTVLLAPDDHHMTLNAGKIKLDQSPPVGSLRPSGTILLSSLSRELGADGAGIVLTGMGDDGSAGLLQMRSQGAFTAAQGKESSVVFGMPEVALRTGAAEFCLELNEIAKVMVHLAGLAESGQSNPPEKKPAS